MPGRSFSSPAYRYGFNGQEKDDEVKGSGNSLNFGLRIYDTRIGRWLSRDPYEFKYSSASPFSFSGNNPVAFIDPDGGSIYWINNQGKAVKISKTTIYKIDNLAVFQGFQTLLKSAHGRDLFKSLSKSKDIDWYVAVGLLPGGQVGLTINAEKFQGEFGYDATEEIKRKHAETFNAKMGNSYARGKAVGTIIDRLEARLDMDLKGQGFWLLTASSEMANTLFHEAWHAFTSGGNSIEHHNLGLVQFDDGRYYILKGGTIYKFTEELSKSYDKLISIAEEKGDKSALELYQGNKDNITKYTNGHIVESKEFYEKRAEAHQEVVRKSKLLKK